MIRTLLLLLSCCFLSAALPAQEVWSLQRCIQYARQNSLTLKQADYGIQNAQLIADQALQNRYPSLNASTGGGVQLGRTIDPTTNEFDNQTIGYSSLGLNAGWTIYNGGRINNQIKQSRINVDAAKTDADAKTARNPTVAAVFQRMCLMSRDSERGPSLVQVHHMIAGEARQKPRD